MRLLTITNLYPRPDQRQRGMFNAQLFAAMAEVLAGREAENRGSGEEEKRRISNIEHSISNTQVMKDTSLKAQVSSEEDGGRKTEDGRQRTEWQRDSQKETKVTKGERAKHEFQVSSLISRVSDLCLINVCLVPEWRVWRWPAIRRWEEPMIRGQRSEIRDQMSEDGGQRTTDQPSPGSCGVARNALRTTYIPVFYVPFIGRSMSWWTYGKSLASLKSVVDAVDVVYSTWLYPDGVAATRIAYACGKPSWIMALGSDTFHLRNRTRRRVILDACAKAKGIICVWKGLADRLIEAGVDAAKIHVVPNGVDAELFRYRSKEEAAEELAKRQGQRTECERERERRIFNTQHSISNAQVLKNSITEAQCSSEDDRYQWADEGQPSIIDPQQPTTHNPQSSKLILFVGNLVPVKGPDILLEAFAQLIMKEEGINSTIPRFPCSPVLLLIGDGPMRSELEMQAQRLGISASVNFLGVRLHDEIALWMNVADCLCLPSRSEGMPNVVLEALASGLPVVATDVGACRELLDEESSCRVARSGDCDGLAEALGEVAVLNARRNLIADHHGKRTWQNQAEQIVNQLLRNQ